MLGLPSLVLAFGTWRQRNANDARDQWWKRATWAVDKALDDSPIASAVGSEALLEMWREPAPEGIDRALVRAFAAQLLENDSAGQSSESEDNGDDLNRGVT